METDRLLTEQVIAVGTVETLGLTQKKMDSIYANA